MDIDASKEKQKPISFHVESNVFGRCLPKRSISANWGSTSRGVAATDDSAGVFVGTMSALRWDEEQIMLLHLF